MEGNQDSEKEEEWARTLNIKHREKENGEREMKKQHYSNVCVCERRQDEILMPK
jgi:hypothetical protein